MKAMLLITCLNLHMCVCTPPAVGLPREVWITLYHRDW